MVRCGVRMTVGVGTTKRLMCAGTVTTAADRVETFQYL